MVNRIVDVFIQLLETADTSEYFMLGYGVVIAGIVIYIISLMLRFSRLNNEKKRLLILLEKYKLERQNDQE